MAAGSGLAGVTYQYGINMDSSYVQVSIATSSVEANLKAFYKLYGSSQIIDAAFGQHLTWDPSETKKTSNIWCDLGPPGYQEEKTNWPTIQDKMIEAMVRLHAAFAPRLKDWGAFAP